MGMYYHNVRCPVCRNPVEVAFLDADWEQVTREDCTEDCPLDAELARLARGDLRAEAYLCGARQSIPTDKD